METVRKKLFFKDRAKTCQLSNVFWHWWEISKTLIDWNIFIFQPWYIYHAIFHGHMLEIIRLALAQKNMSPQVNFVNNKRTPHRSVMLPMMWISTQSARQCLNFFFNWDSLHARLKRHTGKRHTGNLFKKKVQLKDVC